MNTKYGKLISRERDGTLTAVYPEIIIDNEVDFINRVSTFPVTNIGVANAIDNALNTAKEKIKEAFSLSGSGLGWNESAQKGYVNFSQIPEEDIQNIAGSIVEPNEAIVADETTGKLKVDFSKLKASDILALCSSNGAIIASEEEGENNGKLAVDFNELPTSQIEDIVNEMIEPNGAIVVDEETGKLKIDFSKLTPEQIMDLCVDGGGIAADEETGKLKIDFSTMPTDKFEELLSTMKMQVPLESNLDLYVDVNNELASDEITANRGTAELPFASISACINYATQKYALGKYDIRVHIKEGIYYTSTEIVLPSFTHTSGSFYLISEDGYGKAIVRNSSPQNTIFYSSGGLWRFIGMSMELTTTTLDDGYPHHPACIIALYGPDIFIESCKFSARYTGELTSNSISIRAIAVDLNSNLYIEPNNMGPTTFHLENGNTSYSNGNYILYAAQNSHIYFNSTSTPEVNNAYNVYFSGSASYVFLVGAASAACTWGGSLYSTKPAPNPDISLNAQTYHINGGSYMAFGDSMLLPKTGYIDESTYCWYR